ncbi:multiple epidermal growth factor-like domains protein 11 [Saccostrea cucullata]|uniref:multiple epidermal growth factor-like domains protein 11 n=1 Tax=Saccostrea cuccullata TaxID=36930 RepID=UPI002ED5DE52
MIYTFLRKERIIHNVTFVVLYTTCTHAYHNLALRKPAWQANNYTHTIPWGADKAVDGLYSDRGALGNQCTISADKQQTAEWRVDLQSVVSISYINIFYRTDNNPGSYVGRFAGFYVYVSNTTSKEDGILCFHELQNISGTPLEDQRINCSVYGRYVIYYNERRRPDVVYPIYYSQFALNELCEVEVYGCLIPRYYGDFCNKTCPVTCQGQQCDAVTGDCVKGCLSGYQGQHCSYLNLALGRPAWQKHDWPGKPVAWGASKAVDGKYSDSGATGGQCTISGDNQRTAEWRVDLEKIVSISHIHIYYRTDNFPSPGVYYKRFAGFFVYVSNDTNKDNGRLCFHELQQVDGTPTENQTISCPYDGRYVIYYNERKPDVTYPSYYSPYAYSELCELEVYGCPESKYYGQYCDQLCPENCLEQRCNISTGYCIECKPGYKGHRCSEQCDGRMYGPACSQSCGYCLHNTQCHHINGTCLGGCSAGYEGPLCQKQCDGGRFGLECNTTCGHCLNGAYCNRIDGSCTDGCSPGYKAPLCINKCDGEKFGLKCNETCGHCLDGVPCHHINGSCLGGCSPGYNGSFCIDKCDGGWYGSSCSEECDHCFNDTACHHINGSCSRGCSAGFKAPLCIDKCDGRMYGGNCSQTCGHCFNNEQCHHINGTCLQGCSPGYKGPGCKTKCDGGMYGINCNQVCGHCLNYEQCHHINGTCSKGCSKGYKGYLCNSACDGSMYGNHCNQSCGHCINNIQCNHVNGLCYEGCSVGFKRLLCDKACDGGMYGINCNQICGHCVNDEQCHHVKGTCQQGCSRGYKGPLCKAECEGGEYGYNCNESCGHCMNNTTCNHVNGSCSEGCAVGYEGLLCTNVCRRSYWGVNCKENCSTECVSQTWCAVGYDGVLCTNVCSRSYWGVNCKETCSTECVSQTCHHESGHCLSYAQTQSSDTCKNDYTITITSVVVCISIVLMSSLLNFVIWRKMHKKRTGVDTPNDKDYYNEFPSVDIRDKQSGQEMNISPYAELSELDHPNTYEELHQNAKAGEEI